MTGKNDKLNYFKDVKSRVEVNDLEHQVLDYWESAKIFQKTLAATKDKELFTFYDGPPYATGKPHYGHILQSTIKDAVLRYKTMRGYYVPRRVGWDTHGLPVETLVETELGFKTKKDIEDFGIEKFNDKCRETVFRYIDEFTATLIRLGRWAQYDQAYSTLDINYMESEWWVFKQLWEQNLIYKDYKSIPYCIRCETPLSNFEVSTNYKDKVDLAIYVELKVSPESIPLHLSGSNKKLRLLIWTTTPWSLPGNVAVAINPELEYVAVDIEDREIIIAQKRLKDVFGDQTINIKQLTINDILKLKYEPPIEYLNINKNNKLCPIIISDHVTAEDGTGLVHIAPAFGQEDFELGERENISPIQVVDRNGKYDLLSEDRNLLINKRNIFEAQKDIVKNLESRGLLFKKEHIKHSYPFCWRCETPLIYYAIDTWFVRISEIKNQMIKNAEQIHWTPEHVKKGRFGKGLESAPDWAVSRNRFWSVPLPVWVCELCNKYVCIGSLSELQEKSGGLMLNDIHRPYVDSIKLDCDQCTGTMKRVPEVLDVWFDAGSMPYAQWHYPFENKNFVEDNFPADFIVEAIEQTRLWFYVLHVLATALTRTKNDLGGPSPAYKNAIGAGIIMAEDGRKLSKKFKNYPELMPTLEKYGADVIRLYLLSGATLGEPYRFSEKELRHVQRNTYLTLWNVYSFFVRYANTHQWMPKQLVESDNLLDKWILARLLLLEKEVVSSSDAYHIDRATREFAPFIDDLSNWYVRRSRIRFQRPLSTIDRDKVFSTLYLILTRLSTILAPFMPFICETIYRNLTQKDSVHLEQIEGAKGPDNEQNSLLSKMTKVRTIVAESLALRAEAGLKVRQPLETLILGTEAFNDDLVSIIKEEVNVKEIIFGNVKYGDEYVLNGENSNIMVALKITVSEELKYEGFAREIIRHGQVLRRNAGYDLDDRISLIFITKSKELLRALDQNRESIIDALQLDKIKVKGKADAECDIEIADFSVHIGVFRK